jgi:3',5'-cyclic-AMP phosphodiesterase
MLIAHISDPHVRPKNLLYNNLVDSNTMFAEAIRHLNSLDPSPDVVMLSGDVVDQGAHAEYEMALELLAGLEIPFLVIPGNHDEREAFRAAFCHLAHLPKTGSLSYVADDCGPVRIVALDVTLPGFHHGAVDSDALAWLDGVLATDPGRPTIIMMHQPPFCCGIPYLDLYRCEGGDRLAGVVAHYPAIERVVCGHVHRFMQLRFAGTVLCTAPSTTTAIALQLRPDAEPASFIEPPACLIHHWKPDTGLITHLSPIGVFPGPFPFA